MKNVRGHKGKEAKCTDVRWYRHCAWCTEGNNQRRGTGRCVWILDAVATARCENIETKGEMGNHPSAHQPLERATSHAGNGLRLSVRSRSCFTSTITLADAHVWRARLSRCNIVKWSVYTLFRVLRVPPSSRVVRPLKPLDLPPRTFGLLLCLTADMLASIALVRILETIVKEAGRAF